MPSNEIVTLVCSKCKTKHLSDAGSVQAVLVCGTCGTVLQAPQSYTGPGSRPAPGDKRFEGTENELLPEGELPREPAREVAVAAGKGDADEEYDAALEEFRRRQEQIREKEKGE